MWDVVCLSHISFARENSIVVDDDDDFQLRHYRVHVPTTVRKQRKWELNERKTFTCGEYVLNFMRLMTRHSRRARIDNQMMWIKFCVEHPTDAEKTNQNDTAITHSPSPPVNWTNKNCQKPNCYFSHISLSRVVALFICQMLREYFKHMQIWVFAESA